MTKEQEESIENLKGMLEYKRQVYNMDTMRNEIVPALYDIDRKAIETVLSMLKEKDKEIEFQKDIRNTEKNRNKKTEKSLKGIINKQNTELAEKNAEIERLNRQIDLMAEYLIGVHIDNYDPTWEHEFEKDNFIILRSKEEVKQYFERKSEEWKK